MVSTLMLHLPFLKKKGGGKKANALSDHELSLACCMLYDVAVVTAVLMRPPLTKYNQRLDE
jgi:hypothetical protein